MSDVCGCGPDDTDASGTAEVRAPDKVWQVTEFRFATASGLLIAIPVVIANNYFNKKIKVIMQNLEQLEKEALASYHKQ